MQLWRKAKRSNDPMVTVNVSTLTFSQWQQRTFNQSHCALAAKYDLNGLKRPTFLSIFKYVKGNRCRNDFHLVLPLDRHLLTCDLILFWMLNQNSAATLDTQMNTVLKLLRNSPSKVVKSWLDSAFQSCNQSLDWEEISPFKANESLNKWKPGEIPTPIRKHNFNYTKKNI